MRLLFVATLAAAALCLLLGSPADAAGRRHHHRHWHHTAHHYHHHHYRHARRQHVARVAPIQQTGFYAPGPGDSLVSTARRYLGTNPTGRRSLWCGAFVDLVLRQTGHRGGGNLAKGYLRYGARVSGPQVGAIAIMGRRGGGHVGVVSGVDASGNPIIISGNHGRAKTGESVYPRGRVIAYVLPVS